jgi:ribonuclease HI
MQTAPGRRAGTWLPHQGGRAYHNDQRCDWLRKGQRYAQRKGRNLHDIESIAWDSVPPGELLPCEACCTQQWIKRHGRG